MVDLNKAWPSGVKRRKTVQAKKQNKPDSWNYNI